jgi:hypothetical protein
MTEAEPFDPPLHVTFEGVLELVKTVGWVILADEVAVQPFTSVTVTVYVPGANPDISSAVDT